MDRDHRILIDAAKRILPSGYIIVPAAPAASRRWPFSESPGDFTDRLGKHVGGPGGALAGVRTVLIEEPPALSPEFLKTIAV